MIGVFKSKEKLNRAYERTKRPGEEIAVESQVFDTPEAAVDAIKGKYPDFVMTGMNEFQMARIKEAPKRWHLLEGLTAVWIVLLLALLVNRSSSRTNHRPRNTHRAAGRPLKFLRKRQGL